MKVTDVRLKTVTGEGKLKAYVTVTFDDCFVVHNVKIIEGKDGMFIAMPSRKTNAGEYKDLAHPITPAFRGELQAAILDVYNNTSDSERESAPAGESAPGDGGMSGFDAHSVGVAGGGEVEKENDSLDDAPWNTSLLDSPEGNSILGL